MKISTAKAAPKEEKEFANLPHSQRPCVVALSEDFMDTGGAGEAWLSLMEEDTLFNMQDWEAGDGGNSNRRRRTR